VVAVRPEVQPRKSNSTILERLAVLQTLLGMALMPSLGLLALCGLLTLIAAIM